MTVAAAYGVRSMTVPLRRVLVGSPAQGGDFSAAAWRPPDLELLERQHEAFVDTNVRRVLSRVFLGDDSLQAKPKRDQELA